MQTFPTTPFQAPVLGNSGIQQNFGNQPPTAIFKSNIDATSPSSLYSVIPNINPFNQQLVTLNSFGDAIKYNITEAFTDIAVSMPPNVDAFTQVFKATACYKYKTEASATVCIDPDPLSVNPEDKVCRVQNVGMGSQGAPVAVTLVEPHIARNRAQFKIYIANVGKGTVIESVNGRVPIDRCHTLLKRDQVDKVEVRAFLSQNQLLDCKPEIVRLVNGKGFVYCTLGNLEPTGEAYQTNLNVELFYGYRDSIATRVEVLRLPGTEEQEFTYRQRYGYIR